MFIKWMRKKERKNDVFLQLAILCHDNPEARILN